jgi:hypothetical protein
VNRFVIRAGVAALCALTLAGCIDSGDPILSDSQAVFGPNLKLQLYGLRKDYATEPQQVKFKWNGALYVHAGGGLREVSAFSVQRFESGDYIIQEVPAKRPRTTEYALLHKIAEGTYLVIVIDEADADEPTRAAFCGKGTKADPSSCRITTREQLIAFARATAARRHQDGGLAIRLEEDEPKKRRAKPR